MTGFLRRAEALPLVDLPEEGRLSYVIKDIESCYPRMPKATIAIAMRDTLAEIKRLSGRKGVSVPRRGGRRSCAWKARKGDVWLPFDVLNDIAEFSLNNAIVSLNGRLLHQREGIPMGDAISPGMTITTCSWMEKEWMQSIALADKQRFCAVRFMDDILMFIRQSAQWDHERFLADFTRSECYHPPLTLEDAKEDTFLETTFKVADGNIHHWLKNENKPGNPPKVWRYQHWASYCSFEQKRATLSACLKKVQGMASDSDALYDSARQKLEEFKRLAYPRSVLRGACTYMAGCTGCYAWIRVRQIVDAW